MARSVRGWGALAVAALAVAGCGSSTDCQTVICAGGRSSRECTAASSPQRRFLYGGASCTCEAAGGCADCTAKVAAYCAGPSTGGSGATCAAAGQACRAAGDCCDGLGCFSGACAPCGPEGSGCSASADCCDGGVCVGGICAASDQACADDAFGDPAACQDCCKQRHPTGAADFAMYGRSCLCTLGTCQTACATTYCAPTPSGADGACAQCIGDTGCGPVIAQMCHDDPDCLAYQTCAGQCS